MAIINTWFVVINPTSGNGLGKRKWPKIEALLKQHQFNFDHYFTKDENDCEKIIQFAANQGFKNFISVGGDGTLHNVVNGIMSQNIIATSLINVGVIPVGTGNDWIKTHKIPNNIEKAINIIKKGQTSLQDVGEIKLVKSNKKPVYFINLAGIGFDGYVVSKVYKYKHLGALAYLYGTLLGLFSFKNFLSKTTIGSEVIEAKTLMILIGLCQYSGGGMQLTKTPNTSDGLFDISIAKNIGKLDIIKNVLSLFDGSIVNHKKVSTYKNDMINIEITDNHKPYIQADGELIGKGDIEVKIIPKAFSYYY